jgi:hypothetical protein
MVLPAKVHTTISTRKRSTHSIPVPSTSALSFVLSMLSTCVASFTFPTIHNTIPFIHYITIDAESVTLASPTWKRFRRECRRVVILVFDRSKKHMSPKSAFTTLHPFSLHHPLLYLPLPHSVGTSSSYTIHFTNQFTKVSHLDNEQQPSNDIRSTSSHHHHLDNLAPCNHFSHSSTHTHTHTHTHTLQALAHHQPPPSSSIVTLQAQRNRPGTSA